MLGAEDEKAKVTISGNEKLETGENTIKVTVTAEDGTAKTYNISTTKEEKEKLQLSKLQITGITLNETFKPDKYEYSIDLNGTSNITKLDIKATANDETATIEILGNDNFVEGENVVTIMVKSKDGNETATYQIVINKSAGITTENNVSNDPSVTISQEYVYYMYYIKVVDGRLVVFENKNQSIFMETSIEFSTLSKELQEKIETGIFFQTESQLYDFLESYSS